MKNMVRDIKKRILDIATIIGVAGVLILLLSVVPGIIDSNPELGTYIAVAAGVLLIPCSIFVAAYLIMNKIDELKKKLDS